MLFLIWVHKMGKNKSQWNCIASLSYWTSKYIRVVKFSNCLMFYSAKNTAWKTQKTKEQKVIHFCMTIECITFKISAKHSRLCLKAGSHGVIATAIYLSQLMGCYVSILPFEQAFIASYLYSRKWKWHNIELIEK